MKPDSGMRRVHSIDEAFANGDWVSARLTWTGTNTGELFGQPPTGKAISECDLQCYERSGNPPGLTTDRSR
jgi:predicted ester cyclase